MSAVAVLALGASTLVYVPPGTTAVLAWRGGGTPILLGAGFSLRLPFLQRVDRYSGGVLALAGAAEVSSRDGSPITLPYRLSLRPPEQELLMLHRSGGGESAKRIVAELLEDRLKRTAASLGTYDLASGSAAGPLAAQARAVLEERFGAVDLDLGTPRMEKKVMAAFSREAIFAQRVDTGLNVLLIGLDGADWDMMDPMMARGELPNLARIKKEGTWARLRSSVPTLSPLLWTTVATGKSPDRHGINDFLIVDPRTGRQTPINSTFRRAKAIWNLLTEAEMPCDIVAWWATWPAEAISGHLISDRLAYSTFRLGGQAGSSGMVYPPEYAPRVDTLRVADSAIAYAAITRFLHISESEFSRARVAMRGKTPPTEAEESIDLMTRVLAATETYRKVALDLLETRAREAKPARLVAVYFEGIDEVNHRFAHCAPPRMRLCADDDYQKFKDAVPAFYRYQDGIVGELLARAKGATVLVMSDHGFASGTGRPEDVKPFIEGKPGLWHDLVGVFLAAGPGIARGEAPTVTLYDIAPTTLRLLGLPTAEDMPGKVIEAALTPEFRAARAAGKVASYEQLPGGTDRAGEGPPTRAPSPASAPPAASWEGDDEMIAQLRALGYVGGSTPTTGAAPPPAPHESGPGNPGGEAPGGPGGRGVPTLLYHANLATVYLGKKQYDLAEAEYRKALQIDPESPQALSGLSILYEAKGQTERALEMLRALVRQDSADPLATLGKMAELFIRMGRAGDGLAYMESLEGTRSFKGKGEIGLRVAKGELLAAAGRPQEAEVSLLRALRIDPGSIAAMQDLFQVYDAQGRTAELEPKIRAALSRDPGSSMHHNWLGLVFRRAGDLASAETELRTAVELAPDVAGPMANLGSLYLQEERPRDAEAILQRALVKDPRSIESRTNLIVALGALHDLAGARQQVDAAGKLGLRSPLLYNALAYVLHLNGQNDDALATVRQSLALDPSQADAIRLRTMIERGHSTDALPYR